MLQVVNVELFWSYIKERIIPVLGEMSLGNRTQLGLVSEYFLLGKYRIRQIRIKEGKLIDLNQIG